jgi:hypothetical protein
VEPVEKHRFENLDVSIEFDEDGNRNVMLYFSTGEGESIPKNPEELGVMVEYLG